MNLTQLEASTLSCGLQLVNQHNELGHIEKIDFSEFPMPPTLTLRWADGSAWQLRHNDCGSVLVYRPKVALKHTEDLTWAECWAVSNLLMDSKAQETLMRNVESPDAWMLDYVMDSRLRRALDERMAEFASC